MQIVLYSFGGLFELVGITLAAAPDLVPGARRFSRWAAPRWRRFENRIRRLLRLRPRTITASVGLAGEVNLAGSMDAIISVAPTATLDEKVEFLLRRDQERQRDANELRRRIEAIDRDATRRLADLRVIMEAQVEEALAAAATEYRAARVVGAIALAIGLCLSTWGNFIGAG